MIKNCPDCNAENATNAQLCTNCGYDFLHLKQSRTKSANILSACSFILIGFSAIYFLFSLVYILIMLFTVTKVYDDYQMKIHIATNTIFAFSFSIPSFIFACFAISKNFESKLAKSAFIVSGILSFVAIFLLIINLGHSLFY